MYTYFPLSNATHLVFCTDPALHPRDYSTSWRYCPTSLFMMEISKILDLLAKLIPMVYIRSLKSDGNPILGTVQGTDFEDHLGRAVLVRYMSAAAAVWQTLINLVRLSKLLHIPSPKNWFEGHSETFYMYLCNQLVEKVQDLLNAQIRKVGHYLWDLLQGEWKGVGNSRCWHPC